MKHPIKLKASLKYSKGEIKEMLCGIFLMAFILSFNTWGVERLNFLTGLINLFIAFLIVLASVGLRDLVQRLFAFRLGFKIRFRMWWLGILIALACAFITNGAVKLFLLGGVNFIMLPGKRLGKFYYRLSLRSASAMAFVGPLTNILLVVIAKAVSVFFQDSYILDRFILFNLIFAVLCLLPIPPLDGSRMFYHSRLIYSFLFGTALGFYIGSHLLFLPLLYSGLFSLVCGLCFLILFYRVIEKPE